MEAIWAAHAPKSLAHEASAAASAAAAGGADRDQDAKENVGTGSQHPLSRPMIRAWLFEVSAPWSIPVARNGLAGCQLGLGWCKACLQCCLKPAGRLNMSSMAATQVCGSCAFAGPA